MNESDLSPAEWRYEELRAAVKRYVDSWEGLAMGDCAYPEELAEMIGE